VTEHTHEPEHSVRFPSGRVQDICECGASRITDAKGRVEMTKTGAWHTCHLCTHPWGLP
jgi:hypothetical protein